MKQRLASVLAAALCGGLLPWTAQAERAFVPPEVRTSNDLVVGVQQEISAVGGGPMVDSPERRARERTLCQQRGETYVNNEPFGVDGRSREIRVQVRERSYSWFELERVVPEPGARCRYANRPLRRLTIARFDGRHSHVAVFDYDKRTITRFTRLGDQTAMGSQLRNGSLPGSLTDFPRVGERTIAGVHCTEHRHIQGQRDPNNHRTFCITGRRPVPDRELPLVLAEHLGPEDKPIYRWETTALNPRVDVDLAIFEGPPGFREARSVDSGAGERSQ